MSQATRRGILAKVKSLRDSELLPFHEHLDADIIDRAMGDQRVTFNDRIDTPLVTLGLFLSQVIDPDHSCRAAVARLIAWLAVAHRKPCAPETGSYCEARRRLPEGVVSGLAPRVAREAEDRASDAWLWKGRSLTLVDGTAVSMPDTEANQREYPQSSTQAAGLGFPIARLVALISLATGVVRELAPGPYQGKETGETALFRTPWDHLKPGEIVVGDRFFCSSFGIAGLSQRDVSVVSRMHQRRKYDFSRGRCLGVEDHAVTWGKPKRPEWMDEET